MWRAIEERLGRALSILMLVMIVAIITEKRAYAYTDPGTGIMLVQIILSAMFGLLFRLRSLLYRNKRAPSRNVANDDVSGND